MRPEDRGKIKKVKGIDTLILNVDEYGGFTSIEEANLRKKMEDIFSEESLAEIADDMPPGFRKMPLIAVIRSDILGKDVMGWKQHKKALEDGGFEV